MAYTEDTMLKVLFSTLVIRADSINREFGTIANFAVTHDIVGVTNGNLVVIYEMSEPPPYLYHLEDDILQPAGLELYNDYVIAYEQFLMIDDVPENSSRLWKGPSNLNKPIPLCDKAPWLGSIISDIGNFVWDKTKHDISPDPKLVRIESSEGIVTGQIITREHYRMCIKMVSPYIGWELEASLYPPRTARDKTFLSTRGDQVAHDLLEENYEIMRTLDENLEDIVDSHDNLLEELSEIRKLRTAEVRDRIEDKLQSYFFEHNFPYPVVKRGEKYISDILTEYRKNGIKTYLSGNDAKMN